MSCRPEEILSTAELLSDNSKGSDIREAMVRSSVSRAYYAFFHFALLHAPEELPRLRGSVKHEKVIQWMRRHDNENVRKLGLQLDNLRLDRNRCDYHLEQHVDIEVLSGTAKQVDGFIRELRGYLSPTAA